MKTGNEVYRITVTDNSISCCTDRIRNKLASWRVGSVQVCFIFEESKSAFIVLEDCIIILNH